MLPHLGKLLLSLQHGALCVALAVDRVLKPVLAFIVLGWMIWLTIDMRRWVDLLGPAAAERK